MTAVLRILKSGSALLVLTLGLTPAGAAGLHDGVWSITTSAETGTCGTNYDLKLAVKDGHITYAGMWPVKATGGINRAGLINMKINHAGRTVAATGLVRGDEASGDWNSAKPSCSGSWIAKRP
ncbi:MAG TPA: hypothetical protein VLA00_02380 [Xanthobacteraceae bacterium]|nr:hypothetical protein [Xanthobacteraceae bacterium]